MSMPRKSKDSQRDSISRDGRIRNTLSPIASPYLSPFSADTAARTAAAATTGTMGHAFSTWLPRRNTSHVAKAKRLGSYHPSLLEDYQREIHRPRRVAEGRYQWYHIYTDIFRWNGSVTPALILPTIVSGVWAGLWTTWYMLALQYGSTASTMDPTAATLLQTPKWSTQGSLITTLGLVLSLLLVFRNNSAYDRYWEGRRVWGTISKDLRNMGRLIWCHVKSTPEDIDQKKGAMHLLVAFAHAVKHHLRDDLVGYNGTELLQLLQHIPGFHSGHADEPIGSDNIPLEILNYLSVYIGEAKLAEKIDAIVQSNMVSAVNNLVDSLCSLERIRTSPVPLAYITHVRTVLYVYLIALPFQMLSAAYWATIPFCMVTTFAMLGIDMISGEIENPFGEDENDLNIAEYCHSISVELQRYARYTGDLNPKEWGPVDNYGLFHVANRFSASNVSPVPANLPPSPGKFPTLNLPPPMVSGGETSTLHSTNGRTTIPTITRTKPTFPASASTLVPVSPPLPTSPTATLPPELKTKVAVEPQLKSALKGPRSPTETSPPPTPGNKVAFQYPPAENGKPVKNPSQVPGGVAPPSILRTASAPNSVKSASSLSIRNATKPNSNEADHVPTKEDGFIVPAGSPGSDSNAVGLRVPEQPSDGLLDRQAVQALNASYSEAGPAMQEQQPQPTQPNQPTQQEQHTAWISRPLRSVPSAPSLSAVQPQMISPVTFPSNRTSVLFQPQSLYSAPALSMRPAYAVGTAYEWPMYGYAMSGSEVFRGDDARRQYLAPAFSQGVLTPCSPARYSVAMAPWEYQPAENYGPTQDGSEDEDEVAAAAATTDAMQGKKAD
ncbi:Bestrophin, RFP-TM, chloride channel-domain-containing protein [Cladochytrium replicatum]|nr:Bestrophin, RFP-TM, chloride channel-domain-containing protein [Cladochytrium replicatum]